MQVAAKPNLAAIRRALEHNADVEIVELPRLNHLFQRTTTGALSEYTRNPARVDPATSRWLARHV